MEGPESIAVIGMSCRFPQCPDVDAYWANLAAGRECVTFSGPVDAERDGDGHWVPAGGFLDGLDRFDARFFGISARDAEGMDPQQRLFLECAWHGLEDAGYDPERYPGLVGVYAGAALSFYLADLYTNAEALAGFDDYGLALGNDKDHLTTQVAYKLNLRGPGVTVQTACSTSLVAVCLACQSLLTHQCDIALAGGVAADAGTGIGYWYQPGAIFSPDGHCRPFDADAGGTIAGNGVGVVVLKRLSEAVADGDHVRAVIRGFGLNNDGGRKVGYTAPSVEGQAEVVAMAQAMAGVDPATVTYIEAHGTATPLGDPIEIAALDQVFSASTARRQFCAIGSVKSNFGHLDTAAGVASLIKTVLALEHRQIPPSLHFRRPNPRMDLPATAFYVNTTLADWDPPSGTRRAGVSSFGIGGTNAHVVMEEAPAPPPAEHDGDEPDQVLLTVSARSPAALDVATDRLAGFLRDHPHTDLADAAFTLGVGRTAFAHRRAAVVDRRDPAAAADALARRAPRRVLTGPGVGRGARPVVFLFPGQGTQTVGMAADVYRTEPVFRAQLDRCCDLLAPHLGLDLRDLLYPPAGADPGGAARRLAQTAVTQPALFAVEYALAQLWAAWGIAPAAMLGHSIGEYVAACLAGVLTLDDALAVVAARGRLMQAAPPGAMLAVPLPEAALAPHLGARLALAAVNGPDACVLSGTSEAIEALAAELDGRGVDARRLHTSHAYHSHLMAAAEPALVDRLAGVPTRAPTIPYVSNLTGTWMPADAPVEARYWGRHLRRTVRFADGLATLFADLEAATFLEVGPGRTLCDLAGMHPDRGADHALVPSLAGPRDRDGDGACLLRAAGTLWAHGADGVTDGVHGAGRARRRRVSLPPYPFEHQRYFVGPGDGVTPTRAGAVAAPVRARTLDDWFYRPAWRPDPPAPATTIAEAPVRWLVLAGPTPWSDAVVAGLRSRGHHVTVARPGADLAADDPDAYRRLVKDMVDAGGPPAAVAHLWNVTGDPGAGPGEGDLGARQDTGLYSLAYLVQALEPARAGAPVRLDVVADHLHAVLGPDAVEPAKAPLSALCRVVPQEHPGITCRTIDVDAASGIAALVTELAAGAPDPVVAYRHGRRWVQGYEPAPLPDPGPDATRLRTGGVYLVTGGLGKVGLVHAEHLARTARPVLVVTGRSAEPNPDRVRRLEELGAEVVYAAADAADREAMAAVVREARARYGPVNGVVHAAGVTDEFLPVGEITRATADPQLAAKAAGAAVLAGLAGDPDLLGHPDLDFVLLLSSVSTVLGGAGLGAYAAANAYLDALAAERNRAGGAPWIAVDWDAWEVPEVPDPAAASIDAVVPRDGEEALRRILARAPGQVVVSVGDLHERYDRWVLGVADPAAAAPGGGHERPDLDVAYTAARTPAEAALVEIWESLLGVAPVGVLDDFFELGGHSLLAVQLVSRIRQHLGTGCRVHDVFEAPTVAELAALVGESGAGDDEETAALLAEIEGLSDDEVRALLDADPGGP